jgi:hypothetical protein
MRQAIVNTTTMLLISATLLWALEPPTVEQRLTDYLLETMNEVALNARSDYGGMMFAFQVPSTVRLGTTPEISLEIDAAKDIHVGARVEAPAFEISPSGAIERGPQTRVGWLWTLKPEEAGEHTVRIVFDKPIIPPDLKIVSDAPDIIRTTRASLTFRIMVVDEIGLTRIQRVVLTIVKSVVGFAAALFALPLFERLFKRKDGRTQGKSV